MAQIHFYPRTAEQTEEDEHEEEDDVMAGRGGLGYLPRAGVQTGR